MKPTQSPFTGIMTVLVLSILWVLTAMSSAQGDSLDDLYEKARKEGGRLTIYVPFSTRAQEVILPAFEKRFPGIKVNHVDATTDKLVARAVVEARGGKVVGDIFGGTPGYLAQMREQKLLVDIALPEAAAYPTRLKGSFWVATDTQFYIVGWNTSLVRRGEEPKQFEDLADARWSGKLIAEPRDYQFLN